MNEKHKRKKQICFLFCVCVAKTLHNLCIVDLNIDDITNNTK